MNNDKGDGSKPNRIDELTAWLPKSPVAKVLLTILLFWVGIATYCQQDWPGLGRLAVIGLIFTVVSGIVAGVAENRSKPWQAAFYVLMLSTMIWMWFAGSFGSWALLGWDTLALCLGSAMGFVLIRILLFVARSRPPLHAKLKAGEDDFSPAICVFMGWVAISVVTLWRQDELPRDPARFAAIGPASSIVPEQATRWQNVRVGLALSGGGYRAAVFHTGTLRALENLGLQPAVMSTVSGGSIIGSYYSLGGDPVAFKDAVADGRFNLKRELLLLHNAIRLPFPLTMPVTGVKLVPWYEFSRRDVQAGLVKRTLLGDDEGWLTPRPEQPTLVVATADLTFGQQVGLLADGAVIPDSVGGGARYAAKDWRIDTDFTLSQRVAISGGFPGAFPGAPAKVVVGAGEGKRPLMLADGGIVDNSGYLLLRAADTISEDDPTVPQLRSDVFLVSDAGAIFGVEPDLTGLGQLTRAADVGGAAGGVEARLASGERKPRVSFSAKSHFVSPDRQFRLYSGETDQFTGEKAVVFTFDPANGYPRAVLDAIVALFPEKDRDRAAQLVASYWQGTRGEPPADQNVWKLELRDAVEAKRCVPAERSPGICESFELRALMLTLSANLLNEFRLQSTLDDLPSEERVDALFRLGQLLVYVNWPSLQRAMDAASATTAG